MTTNQNVDTLTREIQSLKERLSTSELGNKETIDTKNNQIYTLQHKLGYEREKTVKLRAHVEELENVKQNTNSEIGNREDRIKRIEEGRSEMWENCMMYHEDFTRYFAIRERFDKLNEQFVTLKAKYN
jgi:chromosome segregation ATPase